MGEISYTPDFQHTDWVDGTDRVRAGEPNGFNGRFGTIEEDLRRLSTVVERIDTELDRLGDMPPPAPTLLVVPPTLLAVPRRGWTATATGAALATPGQVGPIGVVNLILPDGVRLISLRAVGRTPTTSLSIALVRISYDASTVHDLAVMSGRQGAYDETVTVDPQLAQVDTSTFRYIITAQSAPLPTTPELTVAALHIVYIKE